MTIVASVIFNLGEKIVPTFFFLKKSLYKVQGFVDLYERLGKKPFFNEFQY